MHQRDYSLSRWSLKFSQEEFEEKFFVLNIERNFVTLRKQAYIYIAVSLIVIVLLLILKSNETKLTIYPSLVIIASISVLIILNWTPRSLNKIFLTFKIFLTVCHIESMILLWSNQTDIEEIFFSTSCLYLSLRLVPANNLPWLFESVFATFSITYVSLRISLFRQQYFWMLNTIYIVLQILNSFTIRENENQHRKDFIKEITSKNKMQLWKFILEEVHPDTTYLINSEDFSKKNKPAPLNPSPSRFIQKATQYFFHQDSHSNKSKFSKYSKVFNSRKIPSHDLEVQGVNANINDSSKVRISKSSDEISQMSSNMQKYNFNIKGPDDMLHLLENTEVVNCIWPRFLPNKDKILLKEEAKVTDVIQILFEENEIWGVMDVGNGAKIMINKGSDSVMEYSKSHDSKSNKIILSENTLQNRKRNISKMSATVKGIYRSERKAIKLNLKLLKFYFDGKAWLFINFEDESQRYELKQLKELDKYKDRLLASVTHDLRTPLNMVIIMIDNARKAEQRAQFLECLNFADVNAKLLQNLICDILDYSLFKEKKLKLTISEFSLNQTVTEVFHLIEYQANMKNIRLRYENFTNEEDLAIISDGRRLKQVLINLVTNALKFTSKGSISVKVWNLARDLLKFEVSDTGKGMEEETIEKLFTPYNTFGNPQGIGLGLWICKSIVEHLGPIGRLYVKSIFGMGSKFGFIIYRDLPNSEIQKLAMSPEEIDEDFKVEIINQSFTVNDTFESDAGVSQMKNSLFYSFSEKNPFFSFQKMSKKENNIESKKTEEQNQAIHEMISSERELLLISSSRRPSALKLEYPLCLKILIVDDNMFNIFIIENYIKKMPILDLEILKATSGEEAIEIFKDQNRPGARRPIDLIFMDSDMPNMDGCATSQTIHEIHKNSKAYKLPIITACTAYQGVEEEDRCFEAGMSYFLTKPISEEEIRNFIQKILKL